MDQKEEIYYLDENLVSSALKSSGIDTKKIHCEICETQLKLGEVGGFAPGSVKVICQKPECKLVVRMKEIISQK